MILDYATWAVPAEPGREEMRIVVDVRSSGGQVYLLDDPYEPVGERPAD